MAAKIAMFGRVSNPNMVCVQAPLPFRGVPREERVCPTGAIRPETVVRPETGGETGAGPAAA